MAARYFIFSLLIAIAGCSSNRAPSTQPVTVRDRQEQALKDPMSYKVTPGPRQQDRDKTWEFDREGFNRDIKNVFNP